MRILVFHNLKSGFGSDAIFEFERAILRPGDECDFRVVGSGLEPRNALADAEQYDLVVCSGGDGTVTNMLYELRYRGVPTCVFPSGTANLLFNNIGNAPEPYAIAQACREPRCIRTDLAEMRWTDSTGRHNIRGFSIMAGIGIDGAIMRTADMNKEAMGEAAYFAAAVSHLTPTRATFTVEVDGQENVVEGIGCIVANTALMQADLQLIPGCVMDDGLLDVMVLESERTTGLLAPVIAGLLDPEGSQLGRPQMTTFRGKHIRVTSSEDMPLQFDGEPTAGTTRSYEVNVLEHANTLIVDRHSPYWASAEATRRRYRP